MTDIYDINVTDIDGNETTLAPYCDKVLLIVNVASKCGLTPQYEGLQSLYEQTKDLGFEVLGFPANDFAAKSQEQKMTLRAFAKQTTMSPSQCSAKSR